VAPKRKTRYWDQIRCYAPGGSLFASSASSSAVFAEKLDPQQLSRKISDTYRPISWNEAYAEIARALKGFDVQHP
jgi:hypothetical protein